MNLYKIDKHTDLRLAMLVGELLTISGAEIRRVENTMKIIIQRTEGNVAHCDCTPGSVGATVTYPEGHTKTMILRINNRNTDFKKIIRLDELAKSYANKEIDFDEAIETFDSIKNMRVAPLYLRSMLNALSCAGFTFLFTPTMGNIISSFIIGFVAMMIYENIFERVEMSSFMQTITATIIISVFAFTLYFLGIPSSPNYVIIGTVTPLLPGVETINAVRDIVESDFLSATSRILNALVSGSAIAVGAGFVYTIILSFGGWLWG